MKCPSCCEEYISSDCIVYMGSDLTCTEQSSCTKLTDVLKNLDAAICAQSGSGNIYIEAGDNIDITGSNTSEDPLVITSRPSGSFWGLTGTSGTTAGVNYLGTTDSVALVFKTNNAERARFLSTGEFGIGTNAPTNPLHVYSSSNPVRFEGLQTGSSSDSIVTADANGVLRKIAYSSFAWNLTGNAGTTPGTNFIGTTDVQALVFKVNNIQAGFLTCRPEPTSAGSGSVTLGQYAGQTLALNNGANTLIGHGAGANIIFNPSKANQNTFIGLWAGYKTMYHSDPFGGRSVLVGQSAGFWNFDGSSLAALGCFAIEMNNRGNNLTAVGRDALRSNIDGHYNTAVGSLSSLYNTTGIKTIAVSNGGSGYTTATVTISSPPGPTPGVAWGVATATATINAGVITGITVTNPGAGYSINYNVSNTRHPQVTVTITGDGTGAAASVTEVYSATGNTSLGFAAGYLNKYGNYNVEIGYLATLNTWGDYNILMGYGTGAGTGAPSTGLIGAIAIGKNAKVSANYTMALGGTGSDAINVGINTETARKKLDVVGGDILVHEHTIGRGPGSVATNTVFGTGVATSSTTALGNVLMGYQVAANGTVSSANVIIGYRASNTASYAGTGNIIIGYESAYLNHANESVAIGLRSMYTQGSNGSVAIGPYSLYHNVRNTSIARQWNTAIGDYSFYNYAGSGAAQVNTGIGAYSGYGITEGSYNVAIGSLSMGKGWSGVGTAGSAGNHNVALGHAALYFQNDSTGNIGIGFNTFNNTSFAPTIGYNIAIGYQAATQLTTGNYNVFLGGYDGTAYATLSNHMVFSDGQGNQRFNVNNSGKMRIFSYGAGTHTGTPTYNLSVDTNGNVIETAAAGTYTFENGLTEAAGNVHLGGVLIEDTTIDGSENIYDLTLANIDALNIQDVTAVNINTLASATNGTSIRGKIAVKGDMSPAQITSDQNDYSPTDMNLHSVMRLSSDASRTITGLALGYEGRMLYIFNVGTNNIVLSNDNVSSVAANRFKIGSDITIAPDRGVQLWYDNTSSRWRAVAV